MMPPHEVYIEPFLGGGAIARLKRPAPLNIAMDLYRPAVDAFLELASSDPASRDLASGYEGPTTAADDSGSLAVSSAPGQAIRYRDRAPPKLANGVNAHRLRRCCRLPRRNGR